jgi:hypothetical protein
VGAIAQGEGSRLYASTRGHQLHVEAALRGRFQGGGAEGPAYLSSDLLPDAIAVGLRCSIQGVFDQGVQVLFGLL